MTLVSGTATVIKARINTVANVGKGFDYDPFPKGDWAEFVSTFTSDIGGETVVRAFTIKNIHRDTKPLSIAVGSEVHRVELTWLVRYFLGHNGDTSDVTFRDLLETIIETLNADRRLTGAPSVLDHSPADYDLPNNGALLSLGDVLCHYAEVTFISYHEIVVATN